MYWIYVVWSYFNIDDNDGERCNDIWVKVFRCSRPARSSAHHWSGVWPHSSHFREPTPTNSMNVPTLQHVATQVSLVRFGRFNWFDLFQATVLRHIMPVTGSSLHGHFKKAHHPKKIYPSHHSAFRRINSNQLERISVLPCGRKI